MQNVFDQMLDTIDALPPGVTVAWLANYHFVRQDYLTRSDCVRLARLALGV